MAPWGDKALLPVDGEPLLVRTVRVVSQAVPRAMIVSNRDVWSRIEHSLGNQLDDSWVCFDIVPHQGPLGGVYTAMKNCEAAPLAKHRPAWILVVACDLPQLSQRILRALCRRMASTTAQAVVPKTPRGLDPLCACYRLSLEPVAGQLLRNGKRAMRDLLNMIEVSVLEWKGRELENLNQAPVL